MLVTSFAPISCRPAAMVTFRIQSKSVNIFNILDFAQHTAQHVEECDAWPCAPYRHLPRSKYSRVDTLNISKPVESA